MLYAQNIPVIFLAFANPQGNGVSYLRNLADEERQLLEILRPLESAGLIKVVHRSNCTAGDILKVFQDAEYRDRISIFHYGGHANSYQLLLETAVGELAVADASAFAKFLGQQQGGQIVFLNGCCTRQQVEALHAEGIPAVIFTTEQIDDKDAVNFACAFYRGLASEVALDRAYEEARAALQFSIGHDRRGVSFGDRKPEETSPESREEWGISVAADDVLNWTMQDALRAMVLKHWPSNTARTSRQNNALDVMRSSGVQSTVLEDWRGFLDAPNWVEAVVERISTADCHKNLIGHIEQMKSVDWTADCFSIWGRLRDLAAVLDKASRVLLDSLHRELKQTKADFHRKDDLKKEISRAFVARDLADDLQQWPLFSRCFLVIGSYGSGKSHFTDSAMRQLDPERFISVELNLDESDISDFDEWLLLSVAKKAGIRFESIRQLDQCLQNCELLLVCVIDDLHRGFRKNERFLQPLTIWIQEITRFHSIRWLITSQDTMFDRLLFEQTFWMTHSASVTDLAGWVSLDSRNRDDLLGSRIVIEQADADTVERLDADPQFKRQLSSPMIAWMYLDLFATKGVPSPGSLNTATFFRTQWQKLFDNRPHDQINEGQLKEACKAVAHVVVESRAFSPELQRVLGVFPRAFPMNLSQSAIEILKEMGVLSIVSSSEDLEPISFIELRFENLWYRWIASELAHAQRNDSNRFQRGIAKWFGLLEDEFACEAIWEFVLLEYSSPTAGRQNFRFLRDEAWGWGFREPEIPMSSAFFAATQTSKEIRQVVLASFLRLRPKANDRALFALMYFIEAAEDLPPQDRLQTLRGLYPQIGRTVLSGYFCHVVRSVIGCIDNNEDLINCAHELVGTFWVNTTVSAGRDPESELITGRVADFVLDRLIDINVDSRDEGLNEESVRKVVQTVVAYFRTEWGQYLGTDDEVGHGPSGTSWFLHECLAERLCEWLLDNFLLMQTFQLLLSCQWYEFDDAPGEFIDYSPKQRSFHRRVMGSKRRLANLRFGHWYRERLPRSGSNDDARHAHVADYLALCESLFHGHFCESELPDSFKEIAFFLVRHTVPRRAHSGEQSEKFSPLVAREFAPLVKEMRNHAATKHFFENGGLGFDVEDDIEDEETGQE